MPIRLFCDDCEKYIKLAHYRINYLLNCDNHDHGDQCTCSQTDILCAVATQVYLCESKQCEQFKTTATTKSEVYKNFISHYLALLMLGNKDEIFEIIRTLINNKLLIRCYKIAQKTWNFVELNLQTSPLLR